MKNPQLEGCGDVALRMKGKKQVFAVNSSWDESERLQLTPVSV